jgi:hypothetical protein
MQKHTAGVATRGERYWHTFRYVAGLSNAGYALSASR